MKYDEKLAQFKPLLMKYQCQCCIIWRFMRTETDVDANAITVHTNRRFNLFLEVFFHVQYVRLTIGQSVFNNCFGFIVFFYIYQWRAIKWCTENVLEIYCGRFQILQQVCVCIIGRSCVAQRTTGIDSISWLVYVPKSLRCSRTRFFIFKWKAYKSQWFRRFG